MSGVLARVSLQTDTDAKEERSITKSVTKAGRSPDGNDFVLDDPEVSRWHAELHFEVSSRALSVVDKNSANGTKINGKSVGPNVEHPLRVGDVVKLGLTKLTVLAVSAAAAAATRAARKPVAIDLNDSSDGGGGDDDGGAVLFGQGKPMWGKRPPLRSATRQKPKPRDSPAPASAPAPASRAQAKAKPKSKPKPQAARAAASRPKPATRSPAVGAAARGSGSGGPRSPAPSGNKVLDNIQRIEAERRERREAAKRKAEAAAEKQKILESGVDIDFLEEIDNWRQKHMPPDEDQVQAQIMVPDAQIRVVVRKRPLNKKEVSRQYDIASCICRESVHTVTIHEPKKRVDLSKFVQHHDFCFDQVVSDEMDNRATYYCSAYPLVRFVFSGHNATCFAYGQTGSGKTWTMSGEGKVIGIYQLTARDMFRLRAQHSPDMCISVSYFEIYGGQVYDLLNGRKRLKVQENAKKEVCVPGLSEHEAEDADDILHAIADGTSIRATGHTSANERSSRSHAVFQIILRKPGKYRKALHGKLSLIDLAGSERGADTANTDRKTRIEGAQINKSLLALKECIRALSMKGAHTPFRASKLTQVLKDSFTGRSRAVMIATISPADNNAEHTCNTLRYADRVKSLSANRRGAVPSLPFPTDGGHGSPAAELVPDSALGLVGADYDDEEEDGGGGGDGGGGDNDDDDDDDATDDDGGDLNDYSEDDEMAFIEKSMRDVDLNGAGGGGGRGRGGGTNRGGGGGGGGAGRSAAGGDATDEEEAEADADQLMHSRVINRVVKGEENLVSAHAAVLELEHDLLDEEQQLWQEASTGAKTYDMDRYVNRLETLVNRKISMLNACQGKINELRKLLLQEESLVAKQGKARQQKKAKNSKRK